MDRIYPSPYAPDVLLTADELAACVPMLQEDAVAYRLLACEALAELHTLTKLVTNQRATIRRVMFGLDGEVIASPSKPWYPPADAPDPPADCPTADDIDWTLR